MQALQRSSQGGVGVAIDLNDVTVRYSGSRGAALNKLSLRVPKGFFTLVTGPNGSGKTTLARLVTGLIPGLYDASVSGAVSVLGVDPRRSPRELADRVGYVSQEPVAQILTPFVRSEVSLPLVLNGLVSREAIEESVRQALLSVASLDLIDRSTFELSGGETTRVVIAANIARKPELLVLDEPTAFLDVESIKTLHRTLLRLKSMGLTILLVTHKPEEFIDLADMVVLLKEGRVSGVYQAKEYLGLFATPPPSSRGYWAGMVENTSCRRSSSSGAPIIRAKNAVYQYPRRGFTVKTGLINIFPGDKVLVLGRNGSGKTTLLKMLSGVYRPQRGSIEVMGRPIYIPQDPRLFFTYETPYRELVAHGVGREQAIVIAETLGFKKYLHEPIHVLSYGTMRKVSVAVGIYGRYDVVMLDEPSAGIDYSSLAELSKILCNTDKTLVVSANEPRLIGSAIRCFNKIIRIENGIVKAGYTPC